jgi:hypothetical protein
LLLDIKRLADTESDTEAMFRDVFDAFDTDTKSPLLGLLSASERKRGKISRVTFNSALKAIDSTFEGSEADEVYAVLSAYIQACKAGLRQHGLENSITNPTLFRAVMLLFPSVAERVSDRHQEFSVTNFDEIVGPFFARLEIGLAETRVEPTHLARYIPQDVAIRIHYWEKRDGINVISR